MEESTLLYAGLFFVCDKEFRRGGCLCGSESQETTQTHEKDEDCRNFKSQERSQVRLEEDDRE